MKRLKKYFSILTVTTLALVLTTTVSANSVIEDGAKPVYKNMGSIFGSTAYDYSVGGIATNKLGQVGMCHNSYGINGDFEGLIPNGINSIGGLFTIINPDGTRLKTLKLTGSGGIGSCSAVSVDADGNFYASGVSRPGPEVIFGTDVGLGANGKPDGYTSKINTAGEFEWYRVISSDQTDLLGRSVIDKNGDLIVSGRTEAQTGGSFTGTSNGGSDLWFAKINTADGSYIIEPKFVGGSGMDGYQAGMYRIETELLTDAQGNIYTTFVTNSPVSGDITKASNGTDIGFVKLDTNLNVVSYNNFGGSGVDTDRGVIRTLNGTYIVGLDSDSTDLPSELNTTLAGTNTRFIELDENFNYIGGRVVGGSGAETMTGYTISPSGDLVILGSTDSTDGDFANRTATDPTGFALYLDSVDYNVKNTFYYASTINNITFSSNGTGNFTVVGETDKVLPGFTDNIEGSSDIYYAVFGPTTVTPAVITHKDYASVLKDTSNVNVKKTLTAIIGKYTEFIDQSELIANPATIDTSVKKTFKIALSGLDATAATGYINVTENKNPVINNLKLIDAPDLLRVITGTTFTSDDFLKYGKISAWNMDTNAPYTVSVDAADLAALNAATTGTVPVKVSITTEARALMTKTVQAKVMTKAEIVADIKAEAEAKWGGDQTEYANIASQAINVPVLTPNEIINKIETTTKTAEEARAELAALLINVDKDGNGKADYNIDIDGNGTADVNKDTDGDGIADANLVQNTDPKGLNYDKDGDGYPDNNIDVNGDGKPDLNIDYDGDGIADFNKDANKDGAVDNPGGNVVQTTDPKGPNYDKDGDGKPDNNIDKDGDGKLDFNIDYNGDGTADFNKDTNKDGVVDTPNGNPVQDTDPNGLNYDKDKDGNPDNNIDLNGDKKPDLNIDYNGDGTADFNKDADKDGIVDDPGGNPIQKEDPYALNYDKDDDGKPDNNLDLDGDGKVDLNIDIDGNGTADFNKDTNKDGVVDDPGGNPVQDKDPNGLNYDKDGDGKPDLNADKDGSGKADLNIDIDKDGIADINKDTDGDGIADENKTQTTDPKGPNYDVDGDEYPDTNIDIDGDGKIDLNEDVDGDGKADINEDTDEDGKADLNIDIDGDKKPDINIDIDGDKKPDINIDIDGDKKPDVNIDIDGDKEPDINIDIDGDKKPDINIDIDGDKKPDINIDIDGDKKPDINIDIDGDKKPDINIDIDGDKKPDINIDIDGDKKPDINIDIDGDKKPDINIDKDGDGTIDLNEDIDGDKKPDLNIDTDGDGIADKNIDANHNGIIDALEGNANNALPTTGVATLSTIATLLGISGLLFARRNRSNI